MRLLVLALAIGMLAIASIEAGDRAQPEAFPRFFDRFAQDEGFRVSRIKFPLHAILGNPTDPRIKEKWSQADLPTNFTAPVASSRLEAEGLEQELTYPSAGEVEVTQSQPASDSYILIYRFKMKGGLWYLVEFENGSY